MSDDSWESYTASDTVAVEPVAAEAELPAGIAPIVDAADNDAWQAGNATSWADWNAETANDATAYANSEVAYAQELFAGGFDEAGDAALARADSSFDVADNHDATADGYYATAVSEADSAASGYGTAADSVADSASYDTTSSYEAPSYDPGVADTGSDSAE